MTQDQTNKIQIHFERQTNVQCGIFSWLTETYHRDRMASEGPRRYCDVQHNCCSKVVMMIGAHNKSNDLELAARPKARQWYSICPSKSQVAQLISYSAFLKSPRNGFRTITSPKHLRIRCYHAGMKIKQSAIKSLKQWLEPGLGASISCSEKVRGVRRTANAPEHPSCSHLPQTPRNVPRITDTVMAARTAVASTIAAPGIDHKSAGNA